MFKKQKRWMAFMMSLVLLCSMLPVPAFAADDMIAIPDNSEWKGSVFGDVGGQDKITASNFTIKENGDGTVTLRSGSDRGKIAGTTEGIAYYYQEVPDGVNFELSATAKVDSWTANNQVSFGVMARSKVAENTNFGVTDVVYATYFSNYVAVGALEQSMKGFYSENNTQVKAGYEFDQAKPAAGNTYDLKLKRVGSSYVLSIGDEMQVIEDLPVDIGYLGLYTARNTKVTFSNVKLHVDDQTPLGAWTFAAFGSNTSASNTPEPTMNEDGSVTLLAKNGKLAKNNEGMAFYYKEIPADANVEIKTTAKISSFNANSSSPDNPNQKSFGLMLKDFIGTGSSTHTSSYVAVGGFGGSPNLTRAFYKQSGSDYTLFDLAGVNAPAPDETYDFKIKKSGSAYVVTVNGVSKEFVLDNLLSGTDYAGFYVARDAEVTFSDFSVVADSRTPDHLLVDASAMKTKYFPGQPLDLSGLKVEAVYGDGSKEALSHVEYIATGFDSSSVGVKPLTIHFNGAAETISNVEIIPLTVTDMQIHYYPAKTAYYPGDAFDPEGFSVIGEYNDGYITEELTGDKYEFSIPGATVTDDTYVFHTPGTQTVYVHSTETPGMFTSFDVEVKNVTLTGLEIRQQPQKTLYFLGEAIDLDGMVVYAKYSDNSAVRLMKNEYTVSPLDTTAAGSKQVTITHKAEQAVLQLQVKEKELTGMEVKDYPQTTYNVGDAFNASGLVVVKVFDNGDTETLAAGEYTLDSSSYDSSQAGTYVLPIAPANAQLAPISLTVTVREAVQHEWKTIRFGQSTTTDKNYVEKIGNDIRLVALEGGGKITEDHDGITFYYTELDAAQDNFELSADIKVVAYAKDPHDGQESFGIMARDVIGTAGDSSVFASNIAAIGGFSGGTKNTNGTQFFVRTGVESSDGAGSKGIQKTMLSSAKPVTSNTYPAADYKLTLSKTNSGFTGKLNNGSEEIFYVPDMLSVQDSKMYVGFYTARLATMEVSNISLKVTAAQSDAPKVEAPKQPVTPTFSIVSLDQTSSSDYSFMVKSNVNGIVTVKQGLNVIAQDQIVEAGKITSVPAVLNTGKTNFSATFLPDDTQYLSSYDKQVQNFTVEMKSYAAGGDIYVAPTGTSAGAGTSASPLDLDTAIAFVQPGQKIIVQAGTYLRSAKLDIKKYNDGTAEAKKYLVAAPGTRPVIDFNKKSEGVVLSGNYWHVKGIDFARSAANTKGFTVGGNYNIVELSRFYENGDTGLQISRTDDASDKALWPSYNLILNSDSFDNRDPSDNNADGFAAKLTVGVGNIFRGTISHNNIDDGWDLYTKAGTGAIGAVLIEDSIAYNNGFLTNGTVGAGDKNGFKLGGEGIHVPHIIRNSVAFGNGAYGFTSNSNPGVIAQDNIGFNNERGNISFTTYGAIPTDFTIDGFVSYQKDYTAADSYPAALKSDNNFMFNGTASVNKSGVQLTDANFESLTPVIPYSRDAEGNIIWGSFLKYIAPQGGVEPTEEAPAAPAAVTAAGGKNAISLTWTASADADSYNVYRSEAESGPYTEIASQIAAGAYNDIGLGNSARYYYVVTAVNEHGESEYSTAATAVTKARESSSGSSGSSGGGGTSAPDSGQSVDTSNEGAIISGNEVKETLDGKTGVKVIVTADSLKKAFDAIQNHQGSGRHITVEVSGSEAVTKVELPAQAMVDGTAAVSGTVLSIVSSGASYQLPLHVLDIPALSGQLGADIANMTITVTFEQVSGSIRDAIAEKAQAAGGTLLSAPVDFTVTAESGGAAVPVRDFGTTYVARTILVNETADYDRLTAVWYHPVTGELTFVPAVFANVNGKTEATIKRPGNSTYAIIRSSRTFEDLQSHWAQKDVELLASKLVVQGVTDGSFAPDARITRAEFAALLVRGLGLNEEASSRFSDVASQDWFAGAVGTAVKAGLVDGFEDGTFQPNESITREQIAVMTVRAMKFAGKTVPIDAKQLDKFSDSHLLRTWSKDAAAQAAAAGIINGVTDTTFVPGANATRAEAAVMLKRFLQVEQLIN
ncbi:bacterial Ig-like domain-containing protein [Paenibacillus sp. y28]|uniref:bacterial Ig-like domain-containing protein n=1 Tax=Paenibacillus sp. y28 TaxID=3129110 RepID=UPI0030176F4F